MRLGDVLRNVRSSFGTALRKTVLTYRSRCELALRRGASHLRNASNCSAVSIVGVLAATYLSLPSVQAHLGAANGSLAGIFLAAGGLIGTALALVFSLSVIAVQRAAEAFSPSITWLYRNDRGTQTVFVALAAFCILSFIMGAGAVVGVSDSILLPVELVIVAVTFDLLRWHYRRLAQLLLPRETVARLLKVIKGYIDRTQSTVRRIARAQLRSMPEAQRAQVSAERIEAAVYATLSNHAKPIIAWTSELAETAVKAIAREETHAARLAVSGLADVATYYLATRKASITLRPLDSMMATATGMAGSDADAVLKPVYECLKDINRRAAAQDSEAACIGVMEAFGRISVETATLDAPAFRYPSAGRRAPISWLPLGYLKDCALAVQRRGFHDAAFRAADAFVWVLRQTPVDMPMHDIYLSVGTGLQELATQSLMMQQGALANEMLKAMLEGLHDALDRHNTQLVHMMRHTLDQVKAMAPLALASAAPQGVISMGMPLSPVYDLTVDVSIGHLVVKSPNLVLDATGEEQSDECRRFHEMNEVIGRHLRFLADDVHGLGATFLVHYITQTIKQICEAYLHIIHRAPEEATHPGRRLADQIGWHLSFFWAVFAKATAVPEGYARDACDTLAYVGLAFANLGETSVAETSVSNICSVAESYWKASKGSNPYATADMLSFAYCVRRLAQTRGQDDLVRKADESLARLESLLGDRWGEVGNAYVRDTKRLEEEIEAPSFAQVLTGGAVSLLARLLRQSATDR